MATIAVYFETHYPSQGIEVTYDHATFTNTPYDFEDPLTTTRIALEAIYFILLTLTAMQELWELISSRKRDDSYFSDVWNFIEVFCIALQVMAVVIWFIIVEKMRRFQPEEQYVVYPEQSYKTGGMLHGRDENVLRELMSMYADAGELNRLLMWQGQLNAAIGIFLMFRLLKQLDFHPRLGIVTRTMSHAFSSFMHFMIVFLTVHLIFTWIGYYRYGQFVSQFETFMGSFIVNYLLLLGDAGILETIVDSPNQSINPWMAWLFILLQFVIVFLILLNVLLAILIDAYTDACNAAEANPLENDERWVAVTGT